MSLYEDLHPNVAGLYVQIAAIIVLLIYLFSWDRKYVSASSAILLATGVLYLLGLFVESVRYPLLVVAGDTVGALISLMFALAVTVSLLKWAFALPLGQGLRSIAGLSPQMRRFFVELKWKRSSVLVKLLLVAAIGFALSVIIPMLTDKLWYGTLILDRFDRIVFWIAAPILLIATAVALKYFGPTYKAGIVSNDK